MKIALLDNWHGDGVGTAVTLRFDSLRGRIVLFGGAGGTPPHDFGRYVGI